MFLFFKKAWYFQIRVMINTSYLNRYHRSLNSDNSYQPLMPHQMLLRVVYFADKPNNHLKRQAKKVLQNKLWMKEKK